MSITTREKIPVMINGIKGKMGKDLAERVLRSDEFRLWNYALTGHDGKQSISIGDVKIQLYGPSEKIFFKVDSGFPEHGIVVDYTSPSSIVSNAQFYCQNGWNFVTGTTGGDREALNMAVRQSNVSALIATNMAKQIVAFQNTLADFSKQHMGGLSDCTIHIKESHQAVKKDKSGSAIAVWKNSFEPMGVPFNDALIEDIRDRNVQLAMGINQEHLDRHGWHTYFITHQGSGGAFHDLFTASRDFMKEDTAFEGYSRQVVDNKDGQSVTRISKDESVLLKTELTYDPTSETAKLQLRLTHNVNGGGVYGEGTMDALRFFASKRGEAKPGTIFSMIDVLKEGARP